MQGVRPLGPAAKAAKFGGKPSWSRVLQSRVIRTALLSVGLLAVASYVWLVVFLHPSVTYSDSVLTNATPSQPGLTSQQEQPAGAITMVAAASPPPPPPASPPPDAPPPPETPDPPKKHRKHPFPGAKYRLWKLPAEDRSPRCQQSQICDGKYECGPDELGCVTDAAKRRDVIRAAGRWTWEGYRKFAWGHDELNAGSRNSREWFRMGLTIVDSLDTLLILGLYDEYAEARHWVINYLDFNQGTVSVFETTIRILGGLTAAFYHSGGDEVFLKKAIEFADRLVPAFNTSSGLAQPQFDVHDKDTVHYRGSSGSTCLAEVGTLSMEFTTVSHLSGQPHYREAAMLFWYQLASIPNTDGLYCTMLYGDSMTCQSNHFTFGSAADSTYEYMLKQWILTNGTDTICLDHYKKALGGMRKHMLTQLWMGPDIGDVWIVAESDGGYSKSLILEHLTCFLPGTMALGHMYGINSGGPGEDDDLTVAIKLMKACYELYHQTATGVAWDSVHFVPHYSPPPPPPPSPPPWPPPPAEAADAAALGGAGGAQSSITNGKTRRLLADDEAVQAEASASAQLGLGDEPGGSNAKGGARRLLQQEQQQGGADDPNRGKIKYEFSPRSHDNFLRPEVAESLFYLWRVTGDDIYREWGWNMFRAYEKYAKVATGGYQVLNGVDRVPPGQGNKMESFWMAETMKYFYLLFSDMDTVPLDEYVFNTEAHPLAIWGTRTDDKMLQRLRAFHARIGKAPPPAPPPPPPQQQQRQGQAARTAA